MFKPALKTKTEQLSSTLYLAEFKLVEPVHSKPLPLQFTNIWIPGVDEIPMSIADYEEEKQVLRIIFKVVGEGTRSLRDRSGFFGVKGFLGNGFKTRGHDRILFVAGGSGIAPLPLLTRYCTIDNCIVDVVWGVKSSDMLFNIEKVALNPGSVYYATEDCSYGFCGMVPQVLQYIIEKEGVKWSTIIAVGPKPMLKSICSTIDPSIEVYVSLETMVKCGLGACGSCVLKPLPKLLCIHGPVFKCNEVNEFLESTHD